MKRPPQSMFAEGLDDAIFAYSLGRIQQELKFVRLQLKAMKIILSEASLEE
jgi:hypothetical protein